MWHGIVKDVVKMVSKLNSRLINLPKELAEGTEVLPENTKQKERKGTTTLHKILDMHNYDVCALHIADGKYDPVWQGPYIIHQNVGKGLQLYMYRRLMGSC